MNKVETQTVAEFKPETWGAFINGEFVPATSGKTFPTFNPGNGEICGHLAECDEERHRESRARGAGRVSGLAQKNRRGARQSDHEAGATRRSARSQARRT